MNVAVSGINKSFFVNTQVDLFKKDIVIMPVNLGNMHWVCAAINIEKQRFEYYDSMGQMNYNVTEVGSVLYPAFMLYTEFWRGQTNLITYHSHFLTQPLGITEISRSGASGQEGYTNRLERLGVVYKSPDTATSEWIRLWRLHFAIHRMFKPTRWRIRF